MTFRTAFAAVALAGPMSAVLGQAEERIDVHHAWSMFGAHILLENRTVWEPYMYTDPMLADARGSYRVNLRGTQLNVRCTPTDSSVRLVSSFPLGADSVGTFRIRFDNLAIISDWRYRRTRTGAQLDVDHSGFLRMARRYRWVVIEIDNEVQRYSLLGFSEMYSRCKRRLASTA